MTRSKTYKVTIEYKEFHNGWSTETTVNGKKARLPEGLRRAIAESYLFDLIRRDEYRLK